MTGRRVEYPHHTSEQVRGYLADALAIVTELDLDDDLRALAFAKAVELLAAKQIVMEQIRAPLLGGLGSRG